MTARQLLTALRGHGIEVWAGRGEHVLYLNRRLDDVPRELLVDMNARHDDVFRLLTVEPMTVGYDRGVTRSHVVTRVGENAYPWACGFGCARLDAIRLDLPRWTSASSDQDRLCSRCIQQLVIRELRALEEARRDRAQRGGERV